MVTAWGLDFDLGAVGVPEHRPAVRQRVVRPRPPQPLAAPVRHLAARQEDGDAVRHRPHALRVARERDPLGIMGLLGVVEAEEPGHLRNEERFFNLDTI